MSSTQLLCRNMPMLTFSCAVPYVVGINPNAPKNPHSAMASGGNDIENIDTSPEQEAYVLYGALVGGPDKLDGFFDIRRDWPQTEVRAASFYAMAACLTTRRSPWIITPLCSRSLRTMFSPTRTILTM